MKLPPIRARRQQPTAPLSKRAALASTLLGGVAALYWVACWWFA